MEAIGDAYIDIKSNRAVGGKLSEKVITPIKPVLPPC
jgi:hypothetical protein